jgi:lipopolysaccharide assembly outer membrane protein LptD (OstA)
MNPYYYLFYKLTYFLNKKGDNEWGVIFALSGLLGWNVVIVYVKAFNITQDNFNGIYMSTSIVIAILLFVANSAMFLNKKRVERIMNRYKNETELKRKIGNVAVLLYAALTVALIVFG